MTRVAVTAVLLALVAVLTPSPVGAGHPLISTASGVRTQVPEALSEEDPTREGRKTPETRAFSAAAQRSGSDRPAGAPLSAATARARHPEPAPLATDHPRARLTPSVLQVFRN